MKNKLYLVLMLIIILHTRVYATEISYRDTLKAAIDNSFDLKMSQAEIGISRAQLKSVRADWYPTLSLQFNTEYNKDLTDGKGTYAYAGNTMITPFTQFRDMLYLTLSYNLLDFGIQGKKVHIAKQELKQKEISYNMQLKDLKLKILDLYTKAQQYSNSITTKTEILKLYENIFTNKERMFSAGINNKLTVMDEAVKIARTKNDIENSRIELQHTLEDLTYYTKQEYNSEKLDFKNIDESNRESNLIEDSNPANVIKSEIRIDNYDFNFDPNLTDESKYYDLEIDKKKAELSILKRQLLPSFRFYTGYSLYGQNPNNYYSSLQDVGQRSLVIGISSQYVFFDGFKNRANREKTKLEIEKLQIEKEKKLAELDNQYRKLFRSYESYNEELMTNRELLNTVKEKLDAVNRLNSKKLIEQNELFSTKAELLNQEYELEQNIINITSKLEEMKIMSGADDI